MFPSLTKVRGHPPPARGHLHQPEVRGHLPKPWSIQLLQSNPFTTYLVQPGETAPPPQTAPPGWRVVGGLRVVDEGWCCGRPPRNECSGRLIWWPNHGSSLGPLNVLSDQSFTFFIWYLMNSFVSVSILYLVFTLKCWWMSSTVIFFWGSNLHCPGCCNHGVCSVSCYSCT